MINKMNCPRTKQTTCTLHIQYNQNNVKFPTLQTLKVWKDAILNLKQMIKQL